MQVRKNKNGTVSYRVIYRTSPHGPRRVETFYDRDEALDFERDVDVSPCPKGGTMSENTGPYIAYDGTFGNPWTVVVRRWNEKLTAWCGIATVGQIASSAEHAIELVRGNGPWPEGAEFVAHPPGDPIGALVWGSAPGGDQ